MSGSDYLRFSLSTDIATKLLVELGIELFKEEDLLADLLEDRSTLLVVELPEAIPEVVRESAHTVLTITLLDSLILLLRILNNPILLKIPKNSSNQ